MAEPSSTTSTRTLQIRGPPSLISSIDIVNRATAPYPKDEQPSGAIISFDFKCPSSLFFGQKELTATFNLNFEIQIKDEKNKPIKIKEVGAGHFNLNNNIAELLNHSEAYPTFNPIKYVGIGKVMTELCPPDDYCDGNDVNVRIVLLLGVYPFDIDVSVSLSALDAASKLKSAVTGTARPYTGSSPHQAKLLDLLCWTAAFGHVQTFEAYLEQMPFGLEMEDAFGMTPFSWAALGGQASVVRLALQQAGSVGARRRTTKGPAPLEAAAHSQNGDILQSFLKWLAYIETPIITNRNPVPAELVEIPKLEHIPDLKDDDFDREIHSAIRNKQTFTTQRLVKLFHNSRSDDDKQRWLANKIVEAAEEGNLDLVQALKSCGAEVNCKNDGNITPLMAAIEKKETKVAEYLIFQGAKDDDNSALRNAVRTCQHSTIRALLQVRRPMEDSLKEELLEIAEKDSTTLMLLKFEKGTEKLATPDDLFREVDECFFATVAEFSEDQSPKFTEMNVHELMHADQDFFDMDDKSSFKWFHLPANNMKWAEVLISKIYYQDPSLAYKVLEPKRWIKRQHEGENGSSHARFMMSACHDFQEAFSDRKKNICEKEDRHVVLFMPYLHWDDEEAMQNRAGYLAKSLSRPSTSSTLPTTTFTTTTNALSSITAAPPTHTSANETLTSASIITPNALARVPLSDAKTQIVQREEVLIEKYLLSEVIHNENSRHLLHVRRTLDQFLYHNLKDTKTRDADQAVRRYQNQSLYHNSNDTKIQDPDRTVRRYQKILHKEKQTDKLPFTVIMVDQLWLWILLSPSGKAQAVVTCFPSRDSFDTTQSSGKSLDPQRTTDILQTTKSYIQQRPDAVKTPYDLAGVIASRCSRALLDHSTDMLDFTEVYENSISYIMNEEVLLFNTFNSLMQTRARAVEELQIRKKTTVGLQFRTWINKILRRESASSDEEAVDKKSDFHLEVDIIDKIEALRSNTKSFDDFKKYCREYREYARFTEIPDETEMKKLKEKLGDEEERKRLINLLEKFGRFFVLDITREISLLRQIKDIQDELDMMGKVFAEQKEVIEAMDRIIRAMIGPKLSPDDKKKTKTSITESNPRTSLISLKSEREHNDAAFNHSIQRRRSNMGELFLFDGSSSTSEDENSFTYERLEYLHKGTQKKNGFKKQAQSMIWHFRHQKHNLPLRTVDRFAKLVKKMNERAKNTNKALTNLVDLKQKQSTMIDTRTARLQAEESHKMAQESESQGRTLMVFTVVTIVFLPLSFIAAFFAIPVKEFGSDNILTLDFVSKITFPVSAATSLLFIGIGFAASKWDWFITLITNHKIATSVTRQNSADLEANIATPAENSSKDK